LLSNPRLINHEFVRPADGELAAIQRLAPDLLAELGPAACGAKMKAWPKFTALGANGPDLFFFFLQDYNNIAIPCDEIMLAMSLLYYLADQGRLDDPYAGLVAILGEVSQCTLVLPCPGQCVDDVLRLLGEYDDCGLMSEEQVPAGTGNGVVDMVAAGSWRLHHQHWRRVAIRQG
jgi:hypothetical protein